MVYEVKFHKFAEEELDEAILYHKNVREGLEQFFYEDYLSIEERLEQNPFQFPISDSGIRKALFTKFQYILYFTIQIDSIKILAILHQKSKPLRLTSRLRDTF